MDTPLVGLKIDVDTYRGMHEGVPRLASILSGHNVKASFFIAMGPDNSGKAVFRFFTKRGFLKKMLRSNAVGMYGIRTALSGTLLPARRIATTHRSVFHKLVSEGHEIGIHGYDHVKWHDKLTRMGYEETLAQIMKACEVYEDIVGRPPESSAAPGWTCSPAQLAVQDTLKMTYHSDSRGVSPFCPIMEGKKYRHLQVPTTLPTLDELLGGGSQADPVELTAYYAEKILSSSLNVLTVHAETEGMGWAKWFDNLLGDIIEKGVRVVPLRDIAANHLQKKADIPHCELRMGTLPGRAGDVAIQII